MFPRHQPWQAPSRTSAYSFMTTQADSTWGHAGASGNLGCHRVAVLSWLWGARNPLFQPGVYSLRINWILLASSQLSMKCKCALLTHRCHPLSVSVQGLIMPIKCQGSLNRCADCLCRMIYWSNTLLWSRQGRTFCLLVIPILVISFHIWASLARMNFFSLKTKWESCYLGAS